MKFKRTRIHFIYDVFTAVVVVVAALSKCGYLLSRNGLLTYARKIFVLK